VATKKLLILICTVTVFALIGCSSNDSVTPTAIDTAPPAVPTQLMGDSFESQIVIYWAPNTTDTDFAGYMVYRTVNDREVCLTQSPSAQNMYVDTSPRGDYNTYKVTAVDLSGNESAHASIGVQMDSGNHIYHPEHQ